MDNGAHKLLESATQRTLHAHAFARSSSQASLVLTDLLSRYLALLTSTCAKYSQHAGRTTMNVRDVLGALEELGVNLDELSEYCATEGKELNRYALYSARRVEDLHEFKSQLADGLHQDRDDAMPLEYARCPTPLLDLSEDEDGEDSDEHEEDEIMDELRIEDTQDANAMDVDVPPGRISALPRKRPPSRPPTPPLPLSPVSNPSSPRRRRRRRSDWDAPEHIPDFLPPFPSMSADTPGSPIDHAPTPHSQPTMPTPAQIPESTAEKQPIMTLSQSLTSAAASDILVQVPYSQSSLASVPEWHLPSSIPPAPPQQNRQPRLPTLQIEPSLLGAFHHILTHPPPTELPPLNPSRHKIAMALIKQGQSNPRYHPSDTLFGSVGPTPPRVATMPPSYPVSIGETSSADKGKDGKEKNVKLPPAIPRPVSAIERIAPFISQQTSQIPNLALHVLPPAIQARTSRLAHPPVLVRGTKALTYGTGIPAPWNANSASASGGPDLIPPTPLTTKEPSSASGKESGKPLLPDARLYATWDYDTKDFRVPLASSSRARSRMGSFAAGSGVISLPVASRTKGVK